MANQCELCKRGAKKANFKSHSQVKTLRRQKINLQSRKINGQRVMICTSCMRLAAKMPVEKKRVKVG